MLLFVQIRGTLSDGCLIAVRHGHSASPVAARAQSLLPGCPQCFLDAADAGAASVPTGSKAAAVAGKGGKGNTYTWQEVAQHNTAESAWVIVEGRVYDITGACRRVVSLRPSAPDSGSGHAPDASVFARPVGRSRALTPFVASSLAIPPHPRRLPGQAPRRPRDAAVVGGPRVHGAVSVIPLGDGQAAQVFGHLRDRCVHAPLLLLLLLPRDMARCPS